MYSYFRFNINKYELNNQTGPIHKCFTKKLWEAHIFSICSSPCFVKGLSKCLRQKKKKKKCRRQINAMLAFFISRQCDFNGIYSKDCHVSQWEIIKVKIIMQRFCIYFEDSVLQKCVL